MRLIALIGLLLVSVTAVSEESCESVIVLSKMVHTSVSDESSVQSHAQNFCREYSSGNVKTTGTSFGASFSFLAASFATANASTEQVASKYCSAADMKSASASAYKQYIESISPKAYAAYERCLDAKNTQDLQYTVNISSVLPTQFNLTASYVSKGASASVATLQYTSSKGVTCAWKDVNGSKLALNTGTTALLECSRNDQSVSGSVTVWRSDYASAPLVIPWQRYDKDEHSVDSLQALSDKLAAASSKISQLEQGKADISTQQTLDSWKGMCVLSPTWNTCPTGFTAMGNFYACFNNGNTIGLDASGMACGGPYDDRHVNVCCR